jgi:D-aminoacyl-tRNA deacylase
MRPSVVWELWRRSRTGRRGTRSNGSWDAQERRSSADRRRERASAGAAGHRGLGRRTRRRTACAARSGASAPGSCLVGVTHDDEVGRRRLAERVAHLRIHPDDDGAMNRSVLDVGGAALVVSQFTLYADTRRGRRPSYVDAAAPSMPSRSSSRVVERLAELGVEVATGTLPHPHARRARQRRTGHVTRRELTGPPRRRLSPGPVRCLGHAPLAARSRRARPTAAARRRRRRHRARRRRHPVRRRARAPSRGRGAPGTALRAASRPAGARAGRR